MPKRVKVTQENEYGRNENFHDNFKGHDMTRNQFVKEISKNNPLKKIIKEYKKEFKPLGSELPRFSGI